MSSSLAAAALSRRQVHKDRLDRFRAQEVMGEAVPNKAQKGMSTIGQVSLNALLL